MKRTFLIFLLIVAANVNAEVVSVRILTKQVISSFIFSPLTGDYKLYGDGQLVADCDGSCIYHLSIINDSVFVKTFEKNIGTFSSISIKSDSTGAFKIKSVIPETKVRMYDDNLTVTLTPDKKQFLLINEVDIEKYIAGVVESEGGYRSQMEYYKLQSILCRTYLLSNINRHVAEGFEVCDDVHCQAYLNRSTKIEIIKSVAFTKGLVVVDNDLNLITAAFHSNCGGQTCNSQDVWAISTSYLKSVQDTFCLSQPHARWRRAIPIEDWKSYLALKHKYPVEDSIKFTNAKSFSQPNSRAIFFMDSNLKIPLKIIRADFQLKSTYFSIEQKNDSVIFNGRGYGHGVGLCQEGAMNMAKLNYNYKDILDFYFKDVHLINLTALNYFKQE
jgi:stage II sporulation protein D